MAVSSTGVRFDFFGRDVSAGRTAGQVEQKMSRLGSIAKTAGSAIAIGIGGAAVGGVAALSAAMVQGVRDAQSYQTLALKTAAVIKSTGNQAKITVKGVQSLAGELESLSGVDEELIINSENVLATFTKIRNETGRGNDIFNQATRAALDMSVALGTDLQGASIQVGKALNDPIKGVTALQRVGVSFTQQQRDQIKTLVESGRTLDAQKLILKELTTEFGGTAKAAGQGFAGSVARAKDAASDFAREMGARALPKLTEFANWFAVEGVPKLRVFEGYIEHTLIPNVVGEFRDLKGKAERALPDIDWSRIGADLKTDAQGWAGKLIDGVKTGIDKGDWKPLGSSLGTAFGKTISGATGVGASISKAVIRWVGEVDWYDVGEEAGKKSFPFAIGFVSHMTDELVKTAKEHPLDTAFAALFFLGGGRIAKRIVESGSSLAHGFTGAFFKAWYYSAKPFNAAIDWFVRGFTGGFVRRARQMFPFLDKLLSKRVDTLADGVRLRAGYLKDATVKFLKAIPDAIGSMTTSILGNIGKLIFRMISMFARSGSWLVGHGIRFVGGLLRGIASTSVGRTVGGVIVRVTSPFRAAGGWLVSAGRNVVGGLLGGIGNRMAGVGGWIKSVVVDPIIGAVKHFFGIKSPSTVMAGIGGHLMAGLEQGMLRVGPGAIINRVFGGMPKALSSMLGKGLVSITSLPMKALKAIGGMFGGLFGGGGGSGVQRWAPLVVQALGMLGQPTTLLGPVLSRMKRESGGNPSAVNLWDINALRGTPSKGLMQVIGPTFDAYAGPFRNRGIWDPFANIYAGLNYALHRYGSLEYAMLKPGGYRLGGRTRPGFSVVGEDGPELLYDDKSNMVIPNARTFGQSAGGVHLHVHIDGVVAGSTLALENAIGTAIDRLKSKGKLKLA